MKKAYDSLEALIREVKTLPEISRAGMLLCHNGIVRESDRSGQRKVRSIRVDVNEQKLDEIRAWGESQAGIVAVRIKAFSGDLAVGDDLLYVVVAGDIRENVFPALRAVVERIKAEGVTKAESYVDERTS